MIPIHHPLVFTFGLLGNIISFMVFLAPVPTFIRIYKKKSTEGFHSVPYVVAIFSCMLWIYYAMIKGNSVLLITINTAGIVIESIYIAIYITYAPKQSKISTLGLLLLMNFGGFCTIVLLCHYLAKGDARVTAFGWVCVAFSVCVFAAPLSIMAKVIRTKSVEYMPFNLSFCLTVTAVIWFMYGLLLKDIYIALPNVGGFIFGVAQMILYGIYRKHDIREARKHKLPEQVKVEVKVVPTLVKQTSVELHPTISSSSDNAIHPQPIPDEDIQIVIMVGISENEEGKTVRKHDILCGPPCNVEAQNIIGEPTPVSVPSPVQLVMCEV